MVYQRTGSIAISNLFGITFQEVEGIGVLRRFQKSLHSLTGLPFSFLDPGAQQSRRLRANHTDLCRFVRTSQSGRLACEECTAKAVKKCLRTHKGVIQTCHMRLKDVYVPLVVRERVVGILSAGQLLFSQPTQRSFQYVKQRLRQLGLDARKARPHYFSLPTCSRRKLEAVMDMMSVITQYVTDAENRLLSLREINRENKVLQAQEFIESRYQEHITIAEVAAAVHLGPSRLSHLFREELQTTFVSFLNDLRLEKVKFLLLNTDLLIAQAAWRVGFRDISHFNHLFKRRFGLCPSDYRTQHNRTKQ